MNENIKLILKKTSREEPEQARLIASYLETGSSADLQSFVNLNRTNDFPGDRGRELGLVLKNSDDYEKLEIQSNQWRLVHILMFIRPSTVWRWVDNNIRREEVDTFGIFLVSIQGLNLPPVDILTGISQMKHYVNRDGQPYSLGRFVLTLHEQHLKILATASKSRELMTLFLLHGQGDCLNIIEDLLDGCSEDHVTGFALTLLKYGSDRYLNKVLEIYRTLTSNSAKYRLIIKLDDYNEELKTEAIDIAQQAMFSDNWEITYVRPIPAVYVAKHCGTQAIDLLVKYIRDDGRRIERVAETLVTSIGIDALPVIQELITKKPHQGYELWANADTKNEYTDEILEGLIKPISDKSWNWAAYAKIGINWNIELIGPVVWPLLKDKSKVIRDEGVELLINAEGVVEKAIELLKEGQAALRETAVGILLHKNNSLALAALREHVKNEKSKKIRNNILEALGEAVPVEVPKELSIDEKIKQTLKKAKKPATPWIDRLRLSPFICDDGTTLNDDQFKYLLVVQSKTKAFELAPELASFYSRLDRTKNADAAFSLLDGFFNNGEDVKEKWILLLAGLLGDQRVVGALDKKISLWADKGRGKLSEYAVMAIAMQGGEAAWVAIDDAARRFSTKYANIGAAAQVAFAAAAESLGISVDELGDRVIPWLGFEPNQPRIVTAGDRTLHVHIGGPTFKFIYFDIDKNKVVKTLPKTVNDEVKQGLKDDAALLRQVVKAQTKRLEALMIRQHRWPVDRWCELFLNHPILKAFGERLIWGHYNEEGTLLDTCRVLEDGSLADINEDKLAPFTSGKMGVLHPLEIDEEQRNQWKQALEDYEVQPPFEQLTRPIFFRTEEDRENKLYTEYSGVQIDGYAFKGRIEKRGWVKGYIGDAGSINTVHKMFPALGIVATLRVDDFGAVIYDDVVMAELFFERESNDLWWGYDTPQYTDKRLVNIKDVSDLAWSEIMSDLAIIGQASSD